MGLFDKVFGAKESRAAVEIPPEESVAAVMLATIGADGHISESEVDGFLAAVNRLKMYQRMTGGEFKRIIDKLMALLNRNGPHKLMELAAGSVPEDLKATTFAICLDLVLVDGHLDSEEEALIERLQGALHIPDGLASKILDVLALKNKA